MKETPDTQLLEDLDIVLGYLKSDQGYTCVELKGLLDEGSITFGLLDKLLSSLLEAACRIMGR